MVLSWATSLGTVALAGDYRAVTWNPSTAYASVSAGSDGQEGRVPTLKDATADVEILAQTGGTQIAALLQPQQAGTLTIQPEGTATNKRKITFPSYSDGAKVAFPYADVAVITCSFSGAGTVLNNYTDGVN